MISLRWISMALLAGALTLGVACGGDDDDNGSTGASTGAVATATTSASTGATGAATGPTGAATGATGSTGATGASGSVKVDDISASLSDLESFRFVMTMKMDFDAPEGQSSEDAAAAAMMAALLGNIQVEGEYVAPDRVRTTSTFFGSPIETIQIGNEAWTNDGTGWVTTPPEEVSGTLPFDVSSPDSMFDFIPAEELEGAKTSKETVNGYDTTRYSFDKDAIARIAEQSGETEDLGDLSEIDEFNLDIWITEDEVPVKMAMNLKGESEGSKVGIVVDFNVTDVNDSGISIDRPI